MYFFFFSSRRRHTRWTGDWSSDVCSSDLSSTNPPAERIVVVQQQRRFTGHERRSSNRWRDCTRRAIKPTIASGEKTAEDARTEEGRGGKEGRREGGADP